MNRGRLLAAIAQKITPLPEKRNVSVERKGECSKEITMFFHEDGIVPEPFKNETVTSIDIGAIDEMLSKFHSNNMKTNDQSEIEIDEDPFHETDFDDSDYVAETDSPSLNTTTDSTREMAAILESNINSSDPINETQVLEHPATSPLKKSNRRNKNLGKEYVTNKNVIVPAKKSKPLLTCRRLCKAQVTFEEQQTIFKLYWNLGDYSKRRTYLSGLIDVEFKKTQKLNNLSITTCIILKSTVDEQEYVSNVF